MAALPHAGAAVQRREKVVVASGVWRKPILDEMRAEVVFTVRGLHCCEAQRAYDALVSPQREQRTRKVSELGSRGAIINE